VSRLSRQCGILNISHSFTLLHFCNVSLNYISFTEEDSMEVAAWRPIWIRSCASVKTLALCTDILLTETKMFVWHSPCSLHFHEPFIFCLCGVDCRSSKYTELFAPMRYSYFGHAVEPTLWNIIELLNLLFCRFRIFRIHIICNVRSVADVSQHILLPSSESKWVWWVRVLFISYHCNWYSTENNLNICMVMCITFVLHCIL
jgi:hypothetical protein